MAVANSGGYLPKGDITFDFVKQDNSKNFDKDRGVFLVPVDGTYVFQFMAHIADSTKGNIKIHVNGKTMKTVYNRDEGTNSREFPLFWSMDLSINDEVTLYNYAADSIYIDTDENANFMGYLVN